jgi:hypothetical protein
MSKLKLVYDYDPIIFKACCAVELRQIKCTNSINKEEHIFKSRTEFYGHYKKKDKGWLAEQTKGGAKYILEDYTIEDIREVQSLENALFIIKNLIKGINEEFSTPNYYGYVGGNTGNFRKDICTLLPYKGNRKEILLPFHLSAAKEYILKNHSAELAQGAEVDDYVVRDMWSAMKNKKELIGVIAEKDFLGCEGNWWNFDQKKLTNVRGFGSLQRVNDSVTGTGRMFKYFQVSWSDKADNYAANCFSDLKNGEIGVYDRLKDCQNDEEAFRAMKQHFMYLYPTPKEIVDCRGDNRVIDWLYVMQECFNMAHLERWKGDRINIQEVLTKLGVI